MTRYRITPGHNYLESLASSNVTVETGRILKFFRNGIEMEDGTKHVVDAVVAATGFDTSFRPGFPLVGVTGEDLRNVWKDEPKSYLSISASGFPNYFSMSKRSLPLCTYPVLIIHVSPSSLILALPVTSGPNFPLANGALIPCLEKCLEYAFDAVSKIQTQGVKAMYPKQAAVDEFQEHKDSLMQDLVWSSGCRSW